MCDRWRDSFDAFFADMGPRPSSKHSIDRIDNEGHYEPGNCRWATMTEQCNNKRNNRHFEAFGKRQTLAQWARELGVTRELLDNRLRLLKWPVEKALSHNLPRITV
jgi:hypothetical protein